LFLFVVPVSIFLLSLEGLRMRSVSEA
jgi:hypothetical protein